MIKAGKAAGSGGEAAEGLKSGGSTVLETIVRMPNVCFCVERGAE